MQKIQIIASLSTQRQKLYAPQFQRILNRVRCACSTIIRLHCQLSWLIIKTITITWPLTYFGSGTHQRVFYLTNDNKLGPPKQRWILSAINNVSVPQQAKSPLDMDPYHHMKRRKRLELGWFYWYLERQLYFPKKLPSLFMTPLTYPGQSNWSIYSRSVRIY